MAALLPGLMPGMSARENGSSSGLPLNNSVCTVMGMPCSCSTSSLTYATVTPAGSLLFTRMFRRLSTKCLRLEQAFARQRTWQAGLQGLAVEQPCSTIIPWRL
jgi:hypothetical protein